MNKKTTESYFEISRLKFLLAIEKKRSAAYKGELTKWKKKDFFFKAYVKQCKDTIIEVQKLNKSI
jgi:hypothetical protein